MQATWIRNAVFHALRSTPGVSLEQLSPNVVYDNPTISSLAQLVAAIASAQPLATHVSTTAGDLEALLARYTLSFPNHTPRLPSTTEKDIVLVTGTTGALGSAVLAKLAVAESVGKIFAYNRPSKQGQDALKRQKDALQARGYDESLAAADKVTLLEGNLTASGLGLESDLEEEVCEYDT